jgi:hypothetical protein
VAAALLTGEGVRVQEVEAVAIEGDCNTWSLSGEIENTSTPSFHKKSLQRDNLGDK